MTENPGDDKKDHNENDEGGDDETYGDESYNDESNNDESKNDESKNDESNDDDSNDDDSNDDDSNDDESSDDESSNDESSNDESYGDESSNDEYYGDEYYNDESYDGESYDGDSNGDDSNGDESSNDESSDVDDASGNDGMSFLEHLEDFRWTVGRSLIAFVIGLGLATLFIGDIAEFLKLPIVSAYGSVELADENLITYRPMGVISVFIQIAFLSGLTLSMPFALYFLAAFVAPGLTEKERAVLRPACFAAFVLFLIGVAFAFFVILPLTLAFSVRLNIYFGFDLFWAASEYYSMVVWFSLATGAFFQFPLIIVILVYLGVIPVEKLKSVRRAVFVGLMIFSAFLTPGGDFVSLPITTASMYGLYELAIWVGGRVERKKRQQELDDWKE